MDMVDQRMETITRSLFRMQPHKPTEKQIDIFNRSFFAELVYTKGWFGAFEELEMLYNQSREMEEEGLSFK